MNFAKMRYRDIFLCSIVKNKRKNKKLVENKNARSTENRASGILFYKKRAKNSPLLFD
jgi:hypothetical protein